MSATEKIMYLNVCDFLFKVVFIETEGVIIQEEWISQIKKHWGNLELKKKNGEVDYTIELAGQGNGVQVFIERKDGDYFKMLTRFEKNKVRLSYAAGMPRLVGIIRDAIIRLSKSTGVLIHASSCLDGDGKLYIFTAKSGGGKSTTAKMLEDIGWTHFGDDSILIRKIGEAYRFYSPPYMEKEYGVAGKSHGSDGVKIMFVNKGKDKVRMEKLDNNIEILKLMMEGIVSLDGDVNKKEMKLLIDFIGKNDFYNLYRNLSKSKLVKVLNEAS